MRRSFGGGGGGGGRNMGGGNGIIRTVQRAVRAGVGGGPPTEPFSPSPNTTINAATNSRKAKTLNKKHPISPSTALTLSSSSSSGNNNCNGTSAFSALINLPLSSSSSSLDCVDESEWECVDDESEDGRARLFYEDYVFGTVPSRDEVHHAVSALQQVVSPLCSPERKLDEDSDKDAILSEVSNPIDLENGISSELDWVEPSLHLCSTKTWQLHGSNVVYDAFHLLETEPSVQRMVVSLSSDKAVWDAVLNNEVVKELRGSISQNADSLIEENLEKGSDDSNLVKDILSWIFTNGKAKITQLIDKIMKIVNEVFLVGHDEKKGDSADPFEEKLKTSLLLSVMVLMIVVITRSKSA